MSTVKMLAIIFPDGRVIAGTDIEDEAHAWRIGLGWPDQKEIEQAKKRGVRVRQLTVELPQC